MYSLYISVYRKIKSKRVYRKSYKPYILYIYAASFEARKPITGYAEYLQAFACREL